MQSMRTLIALSAMLAALAVSSCVGNREDSAAMGTGPGAAPGPPRLAAGRLGRAGEH
ncbi:MAG: hypothetical protein OXU19_16155 [bacterium]|nr:hypothetical protein [bacterium]MDE0240117.1 hypothetical protein [bacterium]MDE0416404.1 hypothetical protein [bacterium]